MRASFIVAFFGGLYAILIFSFLSSQRLGRVREDGWFYACLGVLGTAVMLWVSHLHASGQLPSGLGARELRYVSRAVSLAVFGLIYLRLKRFFTAAHLSGQEPPSPWKAGIGASVAGAGVSYVVATAAAVFADGQ